MIIKIGLLVVLHLSCCFNGLSASSSSAANYGYSTTAELVEAAMPLGYFPADSALVEDANQPESPISFEILLNRYVGKVLSFVYEGDLSKNLLDMLFPGLGKNTVGQGGYVGAIKLTAFTQMIAFFSSMLFFITLIFLSYTIIVTVLDSAISGDAMGKAIPGRLFLFFRIPIAFFAFMPLPTSMNWPGGYSLAQFALYYVALAGVTFANTLWYAFSVAMLATSGGVGEMMLPNVSNTSWGDQHSQQQDTALLASINQVITRDTEILTGNGVMGVPRFVLLNLICAQAKSASTNQYVPPKGKLSKDKNSIQWVFDQCGTLSLSNQNTNVNTFMIQQNAINVLISGLNNLVRSRINPNVKEFRCANDSFVGCQVPFNPFSETGSSYTKQTAMEQSARPIIINYYQSLMLASLLNNPQTDVDSDQLNLSRVLQQLTQSGWAMASSKYFYYASRLKNRVLQRVEPYLEVDPGVSFSLTQDTNAQSLNTITICNGLDVNNICALLASRAYNFLRVDMLTSSSLSSNNLNAPPINSCAADPSSCKYVLNSIKDPSSTDGFSLDNSYLAMMLSGFKQSFKPTIVSESLKPDVIQGNAQQASNQWWNALNQSNSVCGVAFSPQNCGVTMGNLTNSYDRMAASAIMLGFAMMSKALILGESIRVIQDVMILGAIATFPQFSMGFSNIFYAPVGIINALIDPSVLYPKSVALDVYSFTYWMARSWYETFVINKLDFFLHPIDALSRYGFTVLQYSTAFMFRVGTDSFVANYKLSVQYFTASIMVELANLSAKNLSAFIQLMGGNIIGYPEGIMARLFKPGGEPSKWMAKRVPFFIEGLLTGKAGLGKYGDVGVLLRNQIPRYFGPIIGGVLKAVLGLVYPLMIGVFMVLFKIPIVNLVAIPAWYLLTISLFVASELVFVAGKILEVMAWLDIVDMLGSMNDIFTQLSFYINNHYNPFYFGIVLPFILIGSLFAYFIPIYPNIIYAVAVLGWLLLFVEAMIAAPLILLDLTNPKGHPLLGSMKQIQMILIAIVLKPVLVVTGFIFANMIASIAVILFYHVAFPALNQSLASWLGTIGASTSGDVLYPVMLVITMIMYIYMLYQMVLYSYSLVYTVPNKVLRWVGGQADQTSEEEVAKQIAESFKGITKNMSSGAKGSTEKTSSSPREIVSAEK